MSERSKGDTSSSMSASATTARVVKNPLLSASVTGLTFDDFQNKPLLLPAAPPIIHPAPIPSSRESTPLVTVGKSSDIDSEDLSEINLNDISGTSSSTNADKSDENCNTLLEPVQSDNSILSQAASSFSQLPSVASSVFSTFSKKFSSASLRDDVNSNTVPQLDIQPFATEFPSQPPLSLPPPPSGFGNLEQEGSGSYTDNQAKPPIAPPTFYSPSEVPTIPSGTTGAPTALGQNTYRISAKKKIYAPIPGLSSNHTDQNFPTTSATTTFLPPIGFETASLPVYGEPAHNKPEEKKGGLFSLSNFVPAVPNVLQNLSGLVQSATGSLAQKTQGQTPEQPIDSLASFQIETHGQDPSSHYPSPGQTNFFEINQVPQQASIYQAAPPVNFFAPETVLQSQRSTPAHLTDQNSFLQVQAPTATGLFPPLPPQSEVAATIFAPFASNPQPSAPPLPPSSVSGGNTQALQPEGNSASDPSQSVPPLPTKPPSSATSSTSFRLQKGTRLYKSPFAAASPDYQHHAGYGYTPAPQNIIPLNQQPTEIFGHFNPLQENPLLTQSPVIQPTVAEKTSTPPIVKPTSASEIIPENLSQGTIPDLKIFNPIQTISQEDNSFNQSLPPTLSTSPGLVNDQPAEQSAAHSEEIKGEDTEICDFTKEEASVIEPLSVTDTDASKEQVLKPYQFLPQVPSSLQVQPTLLPPPPISVSGFETQSKETANFPPPPPQHSLQNKPNSNPYRRGLQSHQTPLAAPTSLSAIFAPSDQDIHLIKPTVSDSVNTLFEGQPPSVANFFTNSTTSDVFSSQPKGTSSTITQEVSNESTDLILPAPGDFAIKEPSSEPQLPNNPISFPPPQESGASISETLTTAEARSSPAPSVAFGVPPLLATSVENEKSCSPPLQTITKISDNSTLIEETSSGEPDKTSTASAFAISSFFPAAGETEISPNPFKPQQIAVQHSYPPTNLVNFFQADTQPPIAFAVEQSKVSEPKESKPPNQATAAVLPARAKIASPLNPPENPQPQQSVPNLISTFFEPESVTPSVQQQSLPDPTSFFDSFGQVPTVGVDPAPPEDPNSLRIQNFFNNPPPKDLDSVGDLNYDLVGSGLSVKNLQTRSLTPASNLAEPPSSSCSEFSELNSSLSAANRQARLPAEDSAKVSPEEESIFETDNLELPEEILNEIKMANSASGAAFQANVPYTPAVKHWFYKRKEVAKYVWTPFSYYDSALLEDAFLQRGDGPNLVAVEGGRYDVNIAERFKAPVYWEGDPIEVKRCSWFYKGSDSKYVPYEEEVADLLEEEYRKASETCEWHKKIPISSSDTVVFHGPTVIVQFQQQQQVDSWGGTTQTKSRPRVVKRDLDDFTIEEGECHRVDHLLFMIHGIGSACDLKMRPLEEVVDEFRGIALQLVQSHYKNSVENGFVGRVEVLPVSWHGELHSDELGIDEKLKSITLESIPKLRNFTNDTLLDILFYTSPMFCQRIMNTITASMNSVYVKYRQRHPDFQGGVSLAGHSLGSLILFDLLCHQRPLKDCEDQNMENPDEYTPGFPVDSNQLNEDADKHISYKMGPAGTGQPFISYPQLIFQPKKFFALGSPIGMFVTIRGIDKLGLDFRLPTCSGFYNIFHPYDPVAYRLEALVNPDMTGIPPVLIPHHKGRKRMHLEFKETMTRVGADLKQRFFETFKTTFDSVSFLAPKSKNESKEIEKEVDKVLKLQSQQEQHSDHGPSTSRQRTDSNSTNQSDNEIIEVDFPLGKLNDSKRIDYVLQEAPLEFFNEYLFALSSHVCYWESEDTILFVMKEIYNGIGYSPDSQVPQQTMTIERPSSSAGGATQPSS